MKKIIVAGILSLTGCAESDKVDCGDAGSVDAGEDAGCVATQSQHIAFPDMLVHFER